MVNHHTINIPKRSEFINNSSYKQLYRKITYSINKPMDINKMHLSYTATRTNLSLRTNNIALQVTQVYIPETQQTA